MALCPFCNPDPARLIREAGICRVIEDAFPVSLGHTLIVPIQHVASLFDLPQVRLQRMWEVASIVRSDLQQLHKPAGFTIGVNDGIAAGQTVLHAHIHIIPRYEGDVPDCAGGRFDFVVAHPKKASLKKIFIFRFAVLDISFWNKCDVLIDKPVIKRGEKALLWI